MIRNLTPINSIHIPPVLEDENYSYKILNYEFNFRGLKQLLGNADFDKAGDRNAGLAAKDEAQREAARTILSGLTLEHIYSHPLTDDNGGIDEVMQVSYDIDLEEFKKIAQWTVGELKDFLLRSNGEEIKRISPALTAVMAASVAKIADTHELIYIASKISNTTKARTTLGLPGTLSSRLQPNHPTDNLEGISLLLYTGLSLGAGDALLGVNPSADNVSNVTGILLLLHKIQDNLKIPTQICVLGHIKTQMACLENGVPVEIMFQSLAGTKRTNDEFGITVDLLDRAYQTMLAKGALKDIAENFMYFETGQGSEFSYGTHNGIDMTTTEALCYTLARRYHPFMVNNVTGFIGPETHLDDFEMIISNLQDHFMGKLLGLPMGMAPCYTLHSKISIYGQQMATQLLTMAGANYYMDVHLNTDRMLAYFDTSAHDGQTLRELSGKKPTCEYRQWAVGKGILREDSQGNIARGLNWGKPAQFCASEMEFNGLLEQTPAMYGFQTAGPRPSDCVTRISLMNQAIARKAIYSELEPKEFSQMPFRMAGTKAKTKIQHLNNPALGAQLTEASALSLRPENTQVQIVISDGLSAEAVHHNIQEIYTVLEDGLAEKNITRGVPIVAPYGRVKLSEPIAELLQTKIVIMLIGERPGGDAYACRSLSAYIALRLYNREIQKTAADFSGNQNIQFEYTVISNIYDRGLPPLEAGSVILEKVMQIMAHQAAGNRLEFILKNSQS